MQKISRKLKRALRTFPKKHHVEYITALLSIPVLLSVIALNYFNLQNTTKKTPALSTSTKNEQPIIIEVTQPTAKNQPAPTAAPTDTPTCNKTVGPISITSPQEGEVVTDNPVCFTIQYDNENYCSVVWSYRTNGGQWSDYNSNSPCIYNMPNGNTKFELRVQSTVSEDTTSLTRNFIYNGASQTTLTPTPTGK
jgi:hypothetical protein